MSRKGTDDSYQASDNGGRGQLPGRPAAGGEALPLRPYEFKLTVAIELPPGPNPEVGGTDPGLPEVGDVVCNAQRSHTAVSAADPGELFRGKQVRRLVKHWHPSGGGHRRSKL